MRLAALFLLFIAVDILAANRFIVLGMMPMSYFLSGMGICLIFLYFKRFQSHAPLALKRYMSLFLLGVAWIVLRHLWSDLSSTLQIQWYDNHILLMIRIDNCLNHYFSLFFVGLGVALLTTPWRHDSRYTWLLAAAWTTAANHLIYSIFGPVPIWYYRYGDGVVNLLMVFTWLMTLMDALKRESEDVD